MKPIGTMPADYREMVVMFQNETDRGAAVLAGSYIENYLGVYLESFMVDHSLSDRIFGSNGALSSFAQRIDFAQAFGFLTPELCADLNQIRKIRNYFAHHPKEASFSKSPVRDWISSLKPINGVKFENGETLRVDDPRTAYLTSASMFMIVAHQRIYGYGNPEVSTDSGG